MDVLLQNVEGCSWELHLCSRGFAKYYFSKGWRTFAKENKLNIGDCVVFELIDRHPAEVTNPDGVLDVLLQNEEGLSWEVLVRPNGLDQYIFCTGWKDFATDNKLKIGNYVIFELIDRLPDSTFAMNFRICRISVPVPSPVRVQESAGPQEACFTRLPSSLLAQEIKSRGRGCENTTIRKGGSDNHEKLASAIAAESKVNSFSSPFPSFWTIVKPSNVTCINIPVKFGREHLPTKCGEEIMDHVLLQNVEGRSWDLRAKLFGCDMYRLNTGWKTFATDNKLNIGDSVLFELIGRLPDATFVMNFHIYEFQTLLTMIWMMNEAALRPGVSNVLLNYFAASPYVFIRGHTETYVILWDSYICF
ncbi:B3 domain-containing protein REM9-like [Papaver somniferum]|uniref:B3 domain-containing protein REM9-like n=1 Tax=Papaver somniferum TaxID=3469 RepID=UPI000E6FC539|nr:B3 domain-containing protein REM9-like [Papaver somniferum]